MHWEADLNVLAYIDCFSGISGDMALGAFIDLGVPIQWLTDALRGLPLTGFEIASRKVSVQGISGTDIEVRVGKNTGSRNYNSIISLLRESDLSQDIKDKSLNIFDRLATAEAGIHDCPKEKVHFHEVGGVDAIVDIVGTVLCVDYMGIESVVASKVPLGGGFVKSRHGTLPVPAPATLAILKGVPLYGTEIPFELVTPTGAAILVELSESFGKIPEMTVEKIGYGAGKRDLGSVPNLLRIVTGKEAVHPRKPQAGLEVDAIIVIETNIDDMNPEVLGYTMERLFDDGALDVCFFPVFMKKNRPGNMLQVLCHEKNRENLIRRILSETTSLGVRYYEAQRRMLAREKVFVTTSLGRIQVKRVRDSFGGVRIVPEYEICKKIARKNRIPILTVYEKIIKEAGME